MWRRVLRQHSLRSTRPSSGARSEAGDTLVEVLITLVILGVTTVALISGFTTAISASAENKNLSTFDSVLKSFVETATYDLGRAVPTQFVACATASSYSGLTQNYDNNGVAIPASTPHPTYTASITAPVEYWYQNGWTSNSGNCNASATPPQQELLTAAVTNNTSNASQTVQFAVASPVYSPSNPAAPAFTSQDSDTVAAGVSGTFMVTATGSPIPSLSASNLPSWAQFQDQGGGNGLLAFNPPQSAVSGSPYPITFTATSGYNGGTSVNQTFTLTISSPPSFTSLNSNTEAPASNFNFSVTASGNPSPTITTTTSPLPTGISFTSGTGTATLSGNTSTVPGSYTINFVATNSAGTTPQTFTLVISPYVAPSFTSPTSNSGTAVPNVVYTPLQVTATGAPTPSLALTTGSVPGLTFSPSTGQLSGTPTTPGTYNLTFTATNAGGTATWPYALTVSPVSTPRIQCVSTNSTNCTAVSVKKNKSFTFYVIATSAANGFLPNPQVTSSCMTNPVPNELSSTLIQVTATAAGSPMSCTVTVKNEDGGTSPPTSGITVT